MLKPQITRNETVSVSTTSAQVAVAATGSYVRSAITIANLSAANTITIAKSSTPAVASAGVVIGPGGQFSESTDAAYQCWQGDYQVVSSGAGGSVALSETFQGVDE